VLVLGVSLVATGTVAVDGTTQAAFVDGELGDGSVTAAASFDRGPPGPRAYDDANGNGQWDQGEPTYTESDLYSFDDSSADLVVPSDVGTINNSGSIDVTAGSITAETNFQSDSGSVSLAATDGDAGLNDQEVLAAGTASVTATGTANVDGATLIGVFGDASVSGKSVSARNANVVSYFGTTTLSARERGGGPLDATGATLQSRYGGDIVLESSGDMVLETAELQAPYGEITADLRRGSSTLFVDGASITDSDDTLIYSPRGTSVDGTPAAGSVSSGSGGGGRPAAANRAVAPGSTMGSDRSPPEKLERPIDWEVIGRQLDIPLSSTQSS